MPTDIEPVNGRHFAPDGPRARLIALTGLGHSVADAAERVGTSERTAYRWLARVRELTDNKPILERWQRVSTQALDLMGDGLDVIEEDDSGKSALKHLKELNFIAGTGTDKLQKESTPTVTAQNVLIVVNAQKPDVIEGEVVDG